MKKIALCLFAVLLFGTANAQESNNSPKLTAHHVGIHAGGTTGLGFSYRYWPTRWGFQVTGIPIFSQGQTFASFGASALYLLKDNNRVDLFGYFGNHLIIDHSSFTSYDGSGNPIEYSYTDVIDNLGFGLGLKIDMFEVINLNLQAGYGVIDITNSPRTFPTGEIGLYYNL